MTVRITRDTLSDGTMLARMRVLARAHPDMKFRTEAEMAALLEATLIAHQTGEDLYIFGYGSLIWNPAMHFISQSVATVHGWHRRFCLKMYTGRGTQAQPGLMLALDHGGSCRGVAFRIAAAQVREELGVLWQREMYGGSYNARWVRAVTAAGEIKALTFVVNRKHPRYLPELSVTQTAEMIRAGCGDLGTCQEYLSNTVAHLAELGLRDAGLERIVRALAQPPTPA